MSFPNIISSRATGRLLSAGLFWFSLAGLTAVAAQPQASAQPGAADGAMPFELTTLPGFEISLVSSRIGGARFLAAAPNGDIVVSQMRAGRVIAVRPGSAPDAEPELIAEGLSLPNGLTFHDDDLYIATWTGVTVVHNYSSKAERRTSTLISDMPRNRGHIARAIAVAADGTVFISSGSSCNVCNESDPRLATILRYDADGRSGRIYASGLRNASGLAIDRSGQLWAVVNQRDNLTPSHTDLPPDELDKIVDGGDYGWPSCYPVGDRRVANPEYPGASCSRYLPTALNFQAHSAPLGVSFYEGTQFPADYRGTLFVAFHGSWNRNPPTGYKVVAVRFEKGRPVGAQDFVTGWLTADYRVLGRPVGVAVGTDGSLYISDDTGYLFVVRATR